MPTPEKTFIIAEVGSNHDGELQRAMELINIAVDAGADAVKFQLIPPFQPEWIDTLIEYCGDRIEFMATPFNENGINALRGKVKHWKIAATEAADADFVGAVLRAAKDDLVFISDGAIEDPNTIGKQGNNIIPLACVVKYPSPVEEYALGYQGRWGLSDHTTGIFLAPVAVALGASVVEKHFTDDPKRDGPDHIFALNPEQLEEMIKNIRLVEAVRSNKKTTVRTYVGRKLQWP